MANLSPVGTAEREVFDRLSISDPDIRLGCQAILLGPTVKIARLVPASAEEEAARDPDGVCAAASLSS
jgi:hypothetical protein